ncbi:cyclin-domain-containing protein, partial [Marasmius fiardii PR-910]
MPSITTTATTSRHAQNPQEHHQQPPLPQPINPARPQQQKSSATPSSSISNTAKAAVIPATPVVNTAGTFDIHSYPSTDLLRLLASLLAQIAAANDKLDSSSSVSLTDSHSATPSYAPPSPSIEHAPFWRTLTTASRSAFATPSSTLTFHARNIPTITLEAYLLRILKYCPTTNEVFLSLLVYFDRMSKLSADATGRTFVIDSYNIHRLVIAGVTVASKFFSDVFYTNSRYAKVGGLPLAELNQLELQFLLLNDFRLVIPKDEMQRY